MSTSDFLGAWRVDIPQGDGVVIPTYFILHQNGDTYEGTVSIKATVDLPIRNPHWEKGDLVFGSAIWKAAQKLWASSTWESQLKKEH